MFRIRFLLIHFSWCCMRREGRKACCWVFLYTTIYSIKPNVLLGALVYMYNQMTISIESLLVLAQNVGTAHFILLYFLDILIRYYISIRHRSPIVHALKNIIMGIYIYILRMFLGSFSTTDYSIENIAISMLFGYWLLHFHDMNSIRC